MRKVTVLRGAEQLAPLFYGVGDKAKFIGGFVRWMVSPNTDPVPPGDIDIYPNSEDAAVDIRHWIVSNLKLEYYERKGKHLPAYETDVSINFKQVVGPKIQIIKPVNQGHIIVNGSLQQILDNFDFTVCRAGLVSLTEAIVDDEFIQDEMAKRINIKSIHCPIGAIKRIAKYVKKGYYVSPGELYKLFMDWDQRNAEYKEELRAALAAFEEGRFTTGDSGDIDFSDIKSSGEDTRKALARLIYVD